MKLANAPQDVSIPTVLEKRNVAVGSTAMILDLFADKIYSHKELAVVRELSCNAHDSHVVAGTTDIPFLVHIPTALEPWFSIRDFGTGLPDEDIANIYGAIGISTKRQSNDVIGCFGVGSLAPYSMADSFVVKSYYNGTVSTYQCMRDDSRNPVVIPLGSAPTDEHNGLEVKVTVADRIEDFKEGAIKTFKFWSGTTPQINDTEVMSKIAEQKQSYVFEGEDFGLTSSWGQMIAVMGNIAYEIPTALDAWKTDGYIKFDLGELEFDTSRERLDVSDKNRKAIKAKQDAIKGKIKQIASTKVDSLPTPFDKWKMSNSMRFGQTSRLLGTDWFNKYRLPSIEKGENKIFQWTKRYNVWPTSDKVDCLHYTNNSKQSMRFFLDKPRMTGRIKDAMRDLSNGSMFYVFDSVKQAESVGLPKELLEDLEVLPKVVRSRSQGRVKGTTSKYKTFKMSRGSSYHEKDNWTETDLDLDAVDQIVYIPISRWKSDDDLPSVGEIFNTLQSLKDMGVDVPVVYGLKKSFLKTKAFKNNNFVSYLDWLKPILEPMLPSEYDSTTNDKYGLLMSIYKYVEHDTELQSILDAVKHQGKSRSLIRMWNRSFDVKAPSKESNAIKAKVDAYKEKYPMLSFVSWCPTKRSAAFADLAKYLGLTIKD
jgi:hypothetical protein